MAEDRVERRLAAILAADVVGYSRLMGEDEEGTLATLISYRSVIDALIETHAGRVFGGAGDSVIAEFASPVKAVRCATEIQLALDQRSVDVPDGRRMRFRIGVNLGDVIVEGDNLYGDGVNVAARLEGIAEPGGISVSRTVLDHVKGTFAHKGRSVDVRKVATELGARYVLEGSVRRGGERVRISAQLIDAMTGHHVWAEKFDRTLEDIFELQDEITQRIAAIVAPELERAEQKRLATKRTQNLGAWETYLRGMSHLHDMTKNGNARAREMFLQAIGLDPTYSDAFTGLAFTHHQDLHLQIAEDPEKSRGEALAAARQAVVHDPASSGAHVILGIA